MRIRMSNCFLLLILLILSLFHENLAVTFKDVTTTFLKKNTEGLLAAFGDFNADKHPDIFLINEKGVLTVVLTVNVDNVCNHQTIGL